MSGTIQDRVRAAVAAVYDPEVPVTLVDLGVVRDLRIDELGVRVTLRPTRLACPARDEMARRVHQAVVAVDADLPVEIDWEVAGWRGEDVSGPGRQVLLQIGYADPTADTAVCPYCGSADIRREGSFGGSVCKVPFSCRACGSTHDALKGSSALPTGAPRV